MTADDTSKTPESGDLSKTVQKAVLGTHNPAVLDYGSRLGSEYGRTLSGVGGFLSSAWNDFAMPGLDMLKQGVQNPAGNAIFKGIAAVIALVGFWKFLPWLLSRTVLPGDNIASRGARGLISLVGVGAAALTAASVVGTFRKDPEPGGTRVAQVQAAEDERLKARLPQAGEAWDPANFRQS